MHFMHLIPGHLVPQKCVQLQNSKKNKMREPKEALLKQKCIYLYKRQLAADAEDTYINPMANAQGLYE